MRRISSRSMLVLWCLASTFSAALPNAAEPGQDDPRPEEIRLDLERLTLNGIPLQEHLRTLRRPYTEESRAHGQLIKGLVDAFSPLLGRCRSDRFPGTGISIIRTASTALSSGNVDFTVGLSIQLNAESVRGAGTFPGVISGGLSANSSLDQVLELLGEPTSWCVSRSGSKGGVCLDRQKIQEWDQPVSEKGAIRSYLQLYRGRYETAYVSGLHYRRVHQSELDLDVELEEDRTTRRIKIGGHLPDLGLEGDRQTGFTPAP